MACIAHQHIFTSSSISIKCVQSHNIAYVVTYMTLLELSRTCVSKAKQNLVSHSGKVVAFLIYIICFSQCCLSARPFTVSYQLQRKKD